jgi:acyl-[acyl-carrier-protein] desaturase
MMIAAQKRTPPPEQMEVIRGMEPFVRGIVDTHLKPVQDSWQPTDYLPDFSKENWKDEYASFREEARAVSDELLVVLVGDMITEEALPSYQTWINGLTGLKDASGVESNGWALWSRGWTAEENRHGDLLNRYLYLTGRVDMKAVEVTIQNLIRNGFDPETENDPYLGFVYTSFQERATKISHRNASILASRAGEKNLQDLCGIIAGDEARHEKAYQAYMKKIFELDPSGAVVAFARMMKKKIVMPARLMDDGRTEGLFNSFSEVAQRIGVYTAQDYTEILEHLLQTWEVSGLSGLSAEGAEAQEYLCGLPARYRRLSARRTTAAVAPKPFSWVFDRPA